MSDEEEVGDESEDEDLAFLEPEEALQGSPPSEWSLEDLRSYLKKHPKGMPSGPQAKHTLTKEVEARLAVRKPKIKRKGAAPSAKELAKLVCSQITELMFYLLAFLPLRSIRSIFPCFIAQEKLTVAELRTWLLDIGGSVGKGKKTKSFYVDAIRRQEAFLADDLPTAPPAKQARSGRAKRRK